MKIASARRSVASENATGWSKKVDGKVDSFHIDVMDNQFVPNYTLEHFAPPFVAQLKTKSKRRAPHDGNPSKYYNTYFEAGART